MRDLTWRFFAHANTDSQKNPILSLCHPREQQAQRKGPDPAEATSCSHDPLRDALWRMRIYIVKNKRRILSLPLKFRASYEPFHFCQICK